VFGRGSTRTLLEEITALPQARTPSWFNFKGNPTSTGEKEGRGGEEMGREARGGEDRVGEGREGVDGMGVEGMGEERGEWYGRGGGKGRGWEGRERKGVGDGPLTQIPGSAPVDTVSK